jgi:hypothetical protein
MATSVSEADEARPRGSSFGRHNGHGIGEIGEVSDFASPLRARAGRLFYL